MSGHVSQSNRPVLAMIWLQSFSRFRSLAGYIRAIFPSREVSAELPPASRYLITGLRVSIVSTGIITLAAIVALNVSVMVPSTSLGAGASTVSAGEARGEKAYDNVTARPLFARRREVSIAVAHTSIDPAVPAASLPVTALDPNIVYKGVLISGSLEKAFLTSSQNPVGRWIQVDGEIDGWRLVEVRPEQVTLEGQGQTLALKRSVTGK